MVNLTYVQIINHAHRLSNSPHTAQSARVTAAPAMRNIAVFPHDLSVLFFFFFLPLLTLNCMCFKYAFAGVHWPLHTGGELLNSSLLHPSQFSLARAVNRCSLGLLELNRNYPPSSDRGESVHCVIPISPLDIKNAPRIQKGNIMLVSWIWLAKQNLRQGYSRPWVTLSVLYLFISLSSRPLSFCPYASLSFSPWFCLTSSVLLLSLRCSSFGVQLLLLCRCQHKKKIKNRLFRVKVSYI